MGGLCGGCGALARLGCRRPALPAIAAWRSSWAAGARLGRLLLVVVVAAVRIAEQQLGCQRLVAVMAAAMRHQGGPAAHGGQAARHLGKDDLVRVVDMVAHAVPSPPVARSYGANLTTSTPAHSLIASNCACSGTSSLRAKTRAAGSTAPKPPALFGRMPINWGGTRCAASWSSRVTLLMLKNSSLAATSDTGRIWMPSFLPFGAYMNRLRKFPGPLLSRMAWRRLSTSWVLAAASVM